MSESPSWQALLDAVEAETDPRRRANLELVARHVTCEVDGDLFGLLGTLVAEPVYRIWGASSSTGPTGAAEVRRFYQDLMASGKSRLEFWIRRVLADKHAVVTEGEMRHAYPGENLTGWVTEAGDEVMSGEWYLVAYQVLIVWPVDEHGLLEGEEIYAGEAPRVLRRLQHGEMPHLGPLGRGLAHA